MLISIANLVRDSVVITTRDLTSFNIFIYNHDENHFTDIHRSSVGDEIINVVVSEVSEDACQFLAVIVSKLSMHFVSGSTNGSILHTKNIQHSIKNRSPASVHTVYIPLHQRILCFWDELIYTCIPSEEDIGLKQTVLKIDSSKQFGPLQQDYFITEQVLVSMNHGPHVFMIAKSIISGCYSLKCCEVSEAGDVLVWWDADVCSSYVRVSPTSVYNSDDAVILTTAAEIRVYTLDGLLCVAAMGSVLESGDSVTAIRGVHASSEAALQYPPYIERAQFIVATFAGKLFMCDIELPGEGTDADHSLIEVVELVARQLYTSGGFYSLYGTSSSYPDQIVADDISADAHVVQPLLPYFDAVSVLSIGLNFISNPTAVEVADPSEGLLLGQHTSFGVQFVRCSFSPYNSEQDRGMEHGYKTSMFGVLDALGQVNKVLPLPDDSNYDASSFVQYTTDYNYPLASQREVINGSRSFPSPHEYSSMLYFLQQGTPLLSAGSNEYQLEIPRVSRPIRLFTVISNTPLDIIPITQRSYSNNWSTVVIISSDALGESSLFSINHAGKFQAVMAQTDVVGSEATIALFRIRSQLVVQVTRSCVNLLQLRNFQSSMSSTLSVSSLSFPSGSSIQNVASATAHWTLGDEDGSSSKFMNTNGQQNASVFAITSKNKILMMQVIENKSNAKSDTMKEVFTHTMPSDVYSVALSEDLEEVNGEKKLVLCVSTWDSRRSLQIVSLLLSKGSCCILSIINSADSQLKPTLGGFYSGGESIGCLPFKYLKICPTLHARFMTNHQRCCVVAGCSDGHVVLFEYEYLTDKCIWKEINQWSSVVKGGIQGITVLSFFNKKHYNFEKQVTSQCRTTAYVTDNKGFEEAELRQEDVIHAFAFFVNGLKSDFLYKFKLSNTPKDSLAIESSVQVTRLLRQSSQRSQVCSVHPLFLSPLKNSSDQNSENEHFYVDNFLWISSNEDATECADEKVSFCVGSKSLYHHSPPCAVAVASKRVPYRVLSMIYLNNATSSLGDYTDTSSSTTYILVMFSFICPSTSFTAKSVSSSTRIGVQVLDCETFTVVWEYSPVIHKGINGHEHVAVDSTVLSICLAPRPRCIPPVAKHSSRIAAMKFSFIIFLSSCNVTRVPATQSGVMCALFCGIYANCLTSIVIINTHIVLFFQAAIVLMEVNLYM